MAISTYAELQTAVDNWLDRTDLATRSPEFIALAEARFKRKIRHYEMEKRATASTVAGQRTLAMPSDYIEMRNLKRNDSSVDVMEMLPPSLLYNNSTSQGSPRYYAVQGDQLALEPVPDSVYELEMNYYAFDVLSDSNTTNWLLTSFPDVYLYGSLVQAEAYLLNDKRVAMWKAALDESMAELRKDDRAARWNGTPLTIRAQY